MENTATAVIHIEHPREAKPPRFTFCRQGYSTYVERRGQAIETQERRARKEKDEFESFTGLLKDINYDNSDKLYCEIILFLDQNKLTGIDLYKLEQKDKERL